MNLAYEVGKTKKPPRILTFDETFASPVVSKGPRGSTRWPEGCGDIEKHHRRKLDSPSGTALMLYDAVKREKNGNVVPVYGRYGRDAKRNADEIGLHAVRGGTVTGEHEVGFYGNGEEILLTHRAENRALFAEGALRAARFVAGKPAGRYEMKDVVAEILA